MINYKDWLLENTTAYITNRKVSKRLKHIHKISPSKIHVKQFHWATLHRSRVQETSCLCQSSVKHAHFSNTEIPDTY